MTSYKGVTQRDIDRAPIVEHDDHTTPSVFTPENLLREARRQKGIAPGSVPNICVLDPDGDLVEYLRAQGLAQLDATWACYHTALDIFDLDGSTIGVVGRAVGAPFAVLVAEELFASGCRLIISITSAGQITPIGTPPYFVLIDRALRDEGTSYHYLPPAPYSQVRPELADVVRAGWDHGCLPLYAGASWTTDAPFRETEAMLARCRSEGILVVEMEAAALYALATAKHQDIICFAHVTNQMAQNGADFEKGVDQGSHAALQIIGKTAQRWRRWRTEHDDRFEERAGGRPALHDSQGATDGL